MQPGRLRGGLYPSLNFAPARINTADGPSRGRDIEPTDSLSLCDVLPFERLQQLHALGVSRIGAAWIRLTLLASLVLGAKSECLTHGDAAASRPTILEGLDDPFAGTIVSFAFCFSLGLVALLALCHGFMHHQPLCHQPPRPASIALFLGLGFWIFCLQDHAPSLLDFPPWGSAGPFIGLTSISLISCNVAATSHAMQLSAMPMYPAGTDERQRAERRPTVRLVADRAVRSRREVLLGKFDSWLGVKASTTLSELIEGREVDPEQISNLLVEYGKELFYAGKSYGRFAETINGINAKRPILKRQLAAAWNLAFAWVADEPHTHRH